MRQEEKTLGCVNLLQPSSHPVALLESLGVPARRRLGVLLRLLRLLGERHQLLLLGPGRGLL